MFCRSVLLCANQKSSTSPQSWKLHTAESGMISKMFHHLAVGHLLLHDFCMIPPVLSPHCGKLSVHTIRNCWDWTFSPCEFSLILHPRDMFPLGEVFRGLLQSIPVNFLSLLSGKFSQWHFLFLKAPQKMT